MLKKFVLLSLFFANSLFAATFNQPTNLINIPIAEEFKSGDFEFGASTDFNSLNKYEFDFKFNFAMTDRVKLGVTLVNVQNAVLNLHGTFVSTDFFNLGGGLLDITSDSNLSTWEEYHQAKLNNFAQYIVSTFKFKTYNLHVGLGKQRPASQTGTSDGTGLSPGLGSAINGLFIGADMKMLSGKAMVEFDGEQLNFGYQYDFSKNGKINVALTEMFSSKKDFNVPSRFLALATSFKRNIYNIYDADIKTVKEKIEELGDLKNSLEESKIDMQEELEFLQRTRDDLIRQVEAYQGGSGRSYGSAKDAVPKKLTPKVEEFKESPAYTAKIEAFSLYQKAFRQYANKDHHQAIESLKEAINMAPSITKFYVQLGSIYYELGKKDEAYYYWKNAYKLDPKDRELNKLPKPVLNYLRTN